MAPRVFPRIIAASQGVLSLKSRFKQSTSIQTQNASPMAMAMSTAPTNSSQIMPKPANNVPKLSQNWSQGTSLPFTVHWAEAKVETTVININPIAKRLSIGGYYERWYKNLIGGRVLDFWVLFLVFYSMKTTKACLVLLLAGVLFVSGCLCCNLGKTETAESGTEGGSTGWEDECSTDDDCPPDQSCVAGMCF